MSPKLLTISDDILIFGETQDSAGSLLGWWERGTVQRAQNQGSTRSRIAALARRSPQSRTSIGAPKKALSVDALDTSELWEVFLAQKLHPDPGACASCSHICGYGHVGHLLVLVRCLACRLFGTWKHAPQTEAERCCICISAYCAGLTLRCPTLFGMQTHRERTCSCVVHLARGGCGRAPAQPFPLLSHGPCSAAVLLQGPEGTPRRQHQGQ